MYTKEINLALALIYHSVIIRVKDCTLAGRFYDVHNYLKTYVSGLKSRVRSQLSNGHSTHLFIELLSFWAVFPHRIDFSSLHKTSIVRHTT